MPGTNMTQAPCRTCTDFKSWAKQQKEALSSNSASTNEVLPKKEKDIVETPRINCPLDKDELGKATWSLLHTIAATYPENPTKPEQSNVKTFFSVFSKLYPCEYCAKDFQKELQADPPEVLSQNQLAQWLCKIHNKVNIKLGKPEFDCSKVNERWRDGWKDGSCD